MKKELLLIFFIFFVLCIPNFLYICKHFVNLTYDYQIFTAWKAAALSGLLPYKDIFFPYGFLSYYKEINPLFSILYLIIAPVLLTVIWKFFYEVYHRKTIAYFLTGVLYLFVLRYTGFEVFTRYGTLIIVGMVFAYYFYTGRFTKRILFLFGAVSGVIFTLFNDVGLYCYLSFVFLLIANQLIKRQMAVKKNVVFFVTFSFGYFVGLIPLFSFLASHGAITSFFSSFQDLHDLSEFAKTPFIHTLRSVDNLFVISCLVFSVFYLAYMLFYSRNKPPLLTYLVLSLVLSTIILEQKNIVRSIDTQLTFIPIIIYSFLAKYFFDKRLFGAITEYKIKLYFLFFAVIIVFIIPFKSDASITNIVNCKEKNITVSAVDKQLLSYLQASPEKYGKIYSFPGETILYVLMKQQMPYYPTIYEGSSLRAQKKIIDYLSNEKINYVVYDYTNISLQDEVPNFLRAAYLHEYILNTYHIETIVGNYLILEKNSKNEDFLQSAQLSKISGFKNLLLNINLKNIPKSEGLFKTKYLTNHGKLIFASKEIPKINEYLETHTVESEDIVIAVRDKDSINSETYLTFEVSNGYKTTIRYNTCNEDKFCIIHLDRLPLFYKKRVLNKVFSEKDTGKEIRLYTIEENEVLW